ncbi:Chromatin complexes subunit BAP18 [Halotydeus destructor]|nr:Chromatin complexes subunit BAP18 [Halotydeus destructor]
MATPLKLSEIFNAAGSAFTQLGELTTHLQENSKRHNPNQSGQKWEEDDVEQLRVAVRRFSEDLNKLSENIKSKSTAQLKNGVKRKLYDEAGLPISQSPSSS